MPKVLRIKELVISLYKRNTLKVNILTIVSLTLFFLIITGCKEQSPVSYPDLKNQNNSNKNTIQSVKVNDKKEKPIGTNNRVVGEFLAITESRFCTDEDPVDCITEHATFLRNDFIQKMPISLNVPYKEPVDWDAYKEIAGFYELWSDKCGFSNEKTGLVINYHCPNIKSVAGSWMDSLSRQEGIVKSFYEPYKISQDFDPNYQSSFLLSAESALDFSNPDHRAFYWIYHMSLAEIMRASKAINTVSTNK